jgi:DNA-binding transcriptional LysR family regulator
MELRHLRYFIAAAEEENITRAAARLHVSQPGLSRQIRDLEHELGFSLLTRNAKSVRLTAAGSVFLQEASAVIKRAEDAVKTARAVVEGGELHVGYAPSLTVGFLPQTMRAFQSEMPRVRVRLHDLSTEEMHTGLRSGKLQMAVIVQPDGKPVRGLRFAELTRLQIRVALPQEHPLASQRSVTLEQLAREPMVFYSRKEYPEAHRHLAAQFHRLGVKPRIVEEHDSVSSLITAIEAGSGISLVAESLGCIAGFRIKMLPVFPAPDPMPIGLAYSGISTPAIECFIQCARQAVASDEMGKGRARISRAKAAARQSSAA